MHYFFFMNQTTQERGNAIIINITLNSVTWDTFKNMVSLQGDSNSQPLTYKANALTIKL